MELNYIKQPRQLFCDDFKFCESFSGKNILITGASGAIGTQVTRILMTQSEAPNLYLFVRDDGNIEDPDILQRIQSGRNVFVKELDLLNPA